MRRFAPGASLVLAATLLSGCISASDSDFGLVPPETVGYAEVTALPQPSADQGLNGQSAVEMTFQDEASQTATYTNTADTAESEFMLAIAPTDQPSEALDAVARISPEPPTNEFAQDAVAVSPVAEPLGRQSQLARLFSFGKTRPPGNIVHLAGGGRQAAPANGAASGATRPVIEPQQANGEALPGVRIRSLFGIGGKSDRASASAPVRVASAGGLARLAPNGLRAQHDSVQMACLKPKLIRLLKKVKRHYGRDVIVTSGYRSAKHNRRAGGARGSRHTTCEAADIQVPGVTKWQLAKYLRTVRGRGGVGTYCHTKSVHIDVGTKRDWNWRCRRR